MSLQHECERFLEQWLVTDGEPSALSLRDSPHDEHEFDGQVGGPRTPSMTAGASESASASGELQDHLHACVDCRKRLAAFRRDQRLLASYFSTVHVPAAPQLALRDALSAASGHPRRTSLAVMPFLLSVILLLLALLAYLMGTHYAQKHRKAETDTGVGDSKIEDARPK